MLLEGGGLPRSPSAPRALLGVSARSSAKPSHNTCGLPPTNTFRPLAPILSNLARNSPALLQTLNLHRWNCNVFLRFRKITVLNYVRNLSGSGLPSPAVVAARPSHRLRALRPGPIAVGSSTPSMPEAVGVLQQKPRRGASLMVQFPPRLVVVKLDLRLVWCPKCSPPRRITVKMGCCGRSGLRFGHNCVGHGVCPPRACALT